MFRLWTCALAVHLSLSMPAPGYCETIVNYGFGTSESPDFTAANATASDFLSGGGLTNISYAGSANARGWNPSHNATEATSSGDYWTFTVTAAPTYTLDLSELTFDDKRGSNGPTGFQLEVNGTLVGPIGTATTSFVGQSYDLSSFVGLTSATIRMLAWNASNNGNSAQWYVDNVTLQGSLNVIPVEPTAIQTPLPSTLLLLATWALPTFGYFRTLRRRMPGTAA